MINIVHNDHTRPNHDIHIIRFHSIPFDSSQFSSICRTEDIGLLDSRSFMRVTVFDLTGAELGTHTLK